MHLQSTFEFLNDLFFLPISKEVQVHPPALLRATGTHHNEFSAIFNFGGSAVTTESSGRAKAKPTLKHVGSKPTLH